MENRFTIEINPTPEFTIELNEQGPQGLRGPQGLQGPQGPTGPQGPQGEVGPANTLAVGSVVKGEEAEVTIEGESPNQTINFVLPKGDKGDKGDQGVQGPQGIQGIQGIQGEVGPRGPKGDKGDTGSVGPQGPKGDRGDIGPQGPQGEIGPQGLKGDKGDTGVSVVGVEEISKVGLVATYRMHFSDGAHFDYEVTDGSVEGVTREQVISLIGYEPASYTSVEGLTTRVETLEERVEDLTVSRANVSLSNLNEVGEKRFTDIQDALDTFVHKTGNETVAGVKTFSSTPVITSGNINLKTAGDGSIQYNGTNFLRKASNGGIILSGTNTIFVRPGGDTNTTGQLFITKDGTVTGTKFVGKLTGDVTGNATTSTKATQDSNGNDIINTYATKVELNTKANCSLSNITDAGKQTIKTVSQEELNNPFSLFDSKYSDHELNNLSWLKSSGQWNAKAVYPTAYDKLLKVYNGTETVEGLSVKLSTEEYTDYDFVLNTADETFRLPIKIKQNFYESTVPVVGNGLTLGLTDGTTNFGLCGDNGSYGLGAGARIYGQNAGTVNTNWLNLKGKSVGVTTDPTKSGIKANLTKVTGLYLYFYVGETVQNANLIDAGRIGEQLANKQDLLQYKMVDSYINGASGYNVWKTPLGYYCEQWGEYGTKIAGSSNVDITLMKAYNSTNFNVQITGKMNSTGAVTGHYVITGSALSTNSIRIYNDADTSAGLGAYWKTSGYLAVDQY